MSEQLKYPIPASWLWTTLGEVFNWGSGGTPKKSNSSYYGGDIPWLIIRDLNDAPVGDSDTKITVDGLKNSSAKWVEPGSVLVAMYGSIGKLGIATKRLTTNQAIAFTQPEPNEAKYLFYYLMYSRSALHRQGKGIAQQNISQTVLKAFPFPLAPLEQQKRIVAKIEELFSHIDAGIAALNKSKQLLKQYRQSVLKAAVTGELTKQWREENKDKLEPASELLERILKERREKWETQQLAQFEAKGKMPKNDKWKQKYKEPVAVNVSTVPNGWVNATLDQLTEYITSGSRGWAKYYSDGGSTFIRAQNLKYDELRLDDVAFVTLPDAAEGMRTRVKLADVLITITGANVTKTGLVNLDIDEGYVSQHVALCRPVLTECADYVYQYLISKEGGRKHLEAVAYGAGKPGLNLENIRTLSVPLPSLQEQNVVREEIDSRLRKVERLEREVDSQLKKAKKNKQALLATAFSGKLNLVYGG